MVTDLHIWHSQIAPGKEAPTLSSDFSFLQDSKEFAKNGKFLPSPMILLLRCGPPTHFTVVKKMLDHVFLETFAGKIFDYSGGRLKFYSKNLAHFHEITKHNSEFKN